jgi:hypothetical protein
MGLRVLAACEELWVCGAHISSGMRQEIAEAKRLGIPIRYVTAAQIKEMECKPEETPSAGLTLRL